MWILYDWDGKWYKRIQTLNAKTHAVDQKSKPTHFKSIVNWEEHRKNLIRGRFNSWRMVEKSQKWYGSQKKINRWSISSQQKRLITFTVNHVLTESLTRPTVIATYWAYRFRISGIIIFNSILWEILTVPYYSPFHTTNSILTVMMRNTAETRAWRSCMIWQCNDFFIV